jgi:hypothetical protein
MSGGPKFPRTVGKLNRESTVGGVDGRTCPRINLIEVQLFRPEVGPSASSLHHGGTDGNVVPENCVNFLTALPCRAHRITTYYSTTTTLIKCTSTYKQYAYLNAEPSVPVGRDPRTAAYISALYRNSSFEGA